MPVIVWTDQMSVGVKLLDNDHKRLVLLVNQLHDGLMSGLAKAALERDFEVLIQNFRDHLAQEDQLLAVTGYPKPELQRMENDRLIVQILQLQMHFIQSTQLAEDLEIMRQLRVLLARHIQSSDRESVVYLRANDVNTLLTSKKTLKTMAWLLPANEFQVAQGVW